MVLNTLTMIFDEEFGWVACEECVWYARQQRPVAPLDLVADIVPDTYV